MAVSSSPVGSSANTTSGPVTKARAMDTRCCSPPDSSNGRCLALEPKPTASRASCARCRRSRHDTPPMCSGNSTFSWAESNGINPNDWNTKPILCRRISTMSASFNLARSSQSNSTVPELGRSSPESRFNNVVLPEPERPVTARKSPRSTVKLMVAKAVTAVSPEPKTRLTPTAVITGPTLAVIFGSLANTA